MADTDWLGLLSGLVQAGTGYVQQNMALKQAKKLAKAQAGAMAGFPMLGTGNMRFASGSGMTSGPFIPAMPYANTGATDAFGPVLGPVVDYFTPGSGGGGGARRGVTYECYTTPSGRSAVGGWRSLGRPMLWSGDISAVRRVARVRRKLGVSRRPR